MAKHRNVKSKKSNSYTFGAIFLILVTLGLAYFYYEKKKTESTADTTNDTEPVTAKTPTSAAKAVSSPFPIKPNSSSTFVEQLQKKLNEVYNAGITKFGFFGEYTQQVLKDNGFVLPLSKVDFDKIMITGKDFSKIANDLHRAISNRNINTALNVLKAISNKTDYANTKVYFESVKTGSVRKSIVTALLDAFAATNRGTNPDASKNRVFLEAEFKRIGLTNVNNKWQL